MKSCLQITLFLILLPAIAWPSDFSCRVSKGVYKPVGMAYLEDASKRDPSIIGKVFYVSRATGEVTGNILLSNAGEKLKVLRDINDVVNTFEVMSTNEHSDVKLLSIDKYENKVTFKYYFDWLGLFLTGECEGP